MPRRRHLIAYDIRDPARLRRVCKLMEAHGERLQYSVFVCDLTKTELTYLRFDAERIMNLSVDSVVIIDLGNVDGARFTFVGRREQLPQQGDQSI